MSGLRWAVVGVVATVGVAALLYFGIGRAGKSITGPKPDLRFGGYVTLDPMFPVAGEEAVMQITIGNEGEADFEGALEVAAYERDPREEGGADAVLSWRFDASIAVGARETFRPAWTAPGKPGALRYYFEIDPEAKLSELSRENNLSLSVLTVVDEPTAMPDLVVGEVTYEPAAPTAGQDFAALVTVTNEGDGISGVPAALDFYVNDPLGPKPRLPGTRRLRVPPLEPGQSHEAMVRLSFENPQLVGVQVQVDTDRETEDSNRSNNVAPLAIVAVGSANQSGKPDLVVTSLELDPAAPSLGTQARLNVRVANQGAADTPNQFSVDVAYGPAGGGPPGFPNSDEPLKRSFDLRFLAAGQEFELPGIEVAFNLGGPWLFEAKVDAYSEIDEGANEGNNERELEVRLVPRP